MKIDFSQLFSSETNNLVSIWDISFVFATDMFFDDTVPPSVKLKIKINDFDDLTGEQAETLKEGLIPLQQWMAEQIIKDIELGLLQASVIHKSIDGKIKPKHSVVENLSAWAETRSIPLDNAYEDFLLSSEIAWDEINVRVDGMSKSLHLHIYDCMYELNPDLHIEDLGMDNDWLEAKIKKLKKKIKKLEKSADIKNQRLERRGEHHAKKREEVLGAALSVLIQWPDQCKNKQGKIQATKIAQLVDKKSSLFWEEPGDPPIGNAKIESLIREWINKTGK